MGLSINKGSTLRHFWCPCYTGNPHLFMAPGEDANTLARFWGDSKHEEAISCLDLVYNLIPVSCIFTRSHKRVWITSVTGTPKMSQSGPLIYGKTQIYPGHAGTCSQCLNLRFSIDKAQ